MNKNIKKIISAFIITGLLLANVNYSFAQDTSLDYENRVAEYSQDLNYDTYNLDNQMESFLNSIEKYSLQEKISKLNQKREDILTKIDSTKNFKEKTKFKYIIAKIDLSIYQLSTTNEILSQNLNSKESQDKIISLQNTLFNEVKQNIQTIKTSLLKYQNTQSGSAKANFDIDLFGEKSSGSLSLNNYNSKDNIFSSQISGDFDLDVNLNGEKTKITSFADLISKDGEFYAMLKNLSFDTNNQEFKTTLEKLKEFTTKQEKYIKLPTDENTKLFITKMQSLDLSKIFDPNKQYFSVYKTIGEKSYLIPTKEFCQTYLNLNPGFFSPKDCNDFYYSSFLNEFLENGDLYIIFDKNIVGYDIKKDDLKKGKIQLTFDDKSILSLNVDIIPNQEKFKNEGLKLNYIKNSSLDIDLKIKEGKEFFKFKSLLNEKNEFSKIDSKFSFDENNINGFLQLDNSSLNGDFKIINTDYNGKKDTLITGEIKGTGLNDYKMQVIGKKYKTQKTFLRANLSKKDSKIDYEMFFKEYNTFGMRGNLEYNKDYISSNNKFILKGGNENFSGNFNLNFDSQNNLNNQSILFDVYQEQKRIINFEFKNNSTIKFEETQINTPTDFTDIKEIIPELQSPLENY